MSDKPKKGLPSPQERPDLYDYYDFSSRPLGEPTGIRMPDYLQKLIDERQRVLAERQETASDTQTAAQASSEL